MPSPSFSSFSSKLGRTPTPNSITGSGGEDPPPTPVSGRTIMSTNIPQVNYYDSCVHFLDLVKQAPDWGYGGGESIPLDANGWPTVVTAGSGVYAGFQCRIPQAGQYVATYTGSGTLAVDFGGSVVSSSPGRYVLQLDGDSSGRAAIMITQSSVANNVRNLRVVPIANEFNHATVLIHPKYSEIIQPFQVLRFMDFFRINDVGEAFNDTTSWASRIPVTHALQGTSKGPAIEYAIQICNINQSDLWLNIPIFATTNWINGAAALVASQLNSNLKVYLEYSNEVWNDAFYNGTRAMALAESAGFPDGEYDSRFGYQNMMGRYAREAFRSAGMANSRVKHVICSHHTFDFRQEVTLDYPYSYGLYSDGSLGYQHADLFCTAPYVAGERAYDPATATDSVATIINKMINIDTPEAIDAIENSAAIAAARNIDFGAYECGQHLYYGDFDDTAMQNKLTAVNRDSGMYTCMTNLLNGMGSNMNGPVCIYTLCQEYTQYGRWGWKENMYQTVNANPRQCPKFDAVIDWIENNS